MKIKRTYLIHLYTRLIVIYSSQAWLRLHSFKGLLYKNTPLDQQRWKLNYERKRHILVTQEQDILSALYQINQHKHILIQKNKTKIDPK